MLIEFVEAVGVKVAVDLIGRHAAKILQAPRNLRKWRYRDQLDDLMCLFRESGVPACGDSADIDDEVRNVGIELDRRGGFAAMRFVAQEVQDQLRPLGGRLAGDYLDKSWSGIGGWVS